MTDVASTTDLDAAVAEARQRYADSRPGSLAAHLEACEVMPGGNTRTVLFHGPFPLRIARGEGARLFDVDGHGYVDLLGEYTAGLYGHSDPVIRAAVAEAVAGGLNLGADNTYEARLARLVVDRFASIEKVRFTNSGTEANLMALGAARAATGGERIIVMDGAYHGGLLTFDHGRSPVNAPYPTVTVEFNDVEGAAAAIRSTDDLAAVVVEPMMGSGGCIPATAEFLRVLREETSRRGVVLIFDEVMTSRVGPGGAQGLYGVIPDMTTLGKYVGGGMSFGAFGGRAEIMDLFDPTRPHALGHAGTFNNNVLSMAAGAAGLSSVFTPETATALSARGDRVRAQLNRAFADAGVEWQCTGLGSILGLHPTSVAVSRPGDLAGCDDRRRELLFLDLLEDGWYIARRGFVALSLALTDADLDGFVAAVDRAVRRRASSTPSRG